MAAIDPGSKWQILLTQLIGLVLGTLDLLVQNLLGCLKGVMGSNKRTTG